MRPVSFARRAIEQAFRREYGRVLAALVSLTGELSEAEDCLADAFGQALVHWPKEGIPERPGAWLLTVARNRAKAKLRHRAVSERKRADVVDAVTDWAKHAELSEYPDERLKLIFTCCHPALDEAARIALTLRTLGGLSTEEIARAFLTSEVTMAQRLVRAKRKIAAAKIPYDVPRADQLETRVDSALRVLYLIFTEGYRATRGDEWVRHELCDEAIALSRALNELLPDQPEALGLEALMRFHHARRDARYDERGIVSLEDQDRSAWRRDELARGHTLLEAALGYRDVGPYQLQAAIMAQHALAATYAQTDWAAIVSLYDALCRLDSSPVVALNRAAAIGMADGAAAGLCEMRDAGLSRSLDRYGPFHAAKAELLRRAGQHDSARQSYARALELATHPEEKRLLEQRLSEANSSD